MFHYGIEHEVAFLRPDGSFADFTNTTFDEFQDVVNLLPRFESDYPGLRVGDLGIKDKRWYVEGYERYDEQGRFTVCVPKGIEIRTSIAPSIRAAVDELSESYRLLTELSASRGFRPAWTAFNPIHARFVPEPPLNGWESARRASSPEKQTAEIPMLTHGPDLSFSNTDWSDDTAIDIGRKLTYYSPGIVPFSFSSPFFDGKRWDGLSVRTWLRTGPRPAAMVFLANSAKLMKSRPSLTKPARVAAEDGRIEFKACDSCRDFRLYAGLLALLKGVALDNTLGGRALVPDAAFHQRSAKLGWDDPAVLDLSAALLAAAEKRLEGDDDAAYLAPLRTMLAQRRTPAADLIDAYERTGSVTKALL